MGVLNETSGTVVQILEKIAEYVPGRLVVGQRTQLHAIHVDLHSFRTKPQLESVFNNRPPLLPIRRNDKRTVRLSTNFLPPLAR